MAAGLMALPVVALPGSTPQAAQATPGTDDYPYKNDAWCATWTGMNNVPPTAPTSTNCQTQYADAWSFYKRECTSFVTWRMRNDNGYATFKNFMIGANGASLHLGHAYQWKDQLAAGGFAHDQTPKAGAVAWWGPYVGGASWAGHVAWVQSVSGDGNTITIEEYNWGNNHNYNSRTITKTGGYWPSEFLHVKDLTATTPQAGPDDPRGNYEDAWPILGGVRLKGYAYDPNTSNPIEVHVYEGACCTDPRGAFTADKSRPDFAYHNPGFGANHGFDMTIGVAAGTTGTKTYCVYAINVGAGSVSPSLGCKTVTLANPVGSTERITSAPGGAHLSGWAVDPDTTNSLEVDVYEGTCCAEPRGAFTADESRPDVAVAYPDHGADHGFEATISVGSTVEGVTKTYCAYGINQGAGSVSPNLGCKTITLLDKPTGNFEDLFIDNGQVVAKTAFRSC